MAFGVQSRGSYNVQIRRLLLIIGLTVVVVVLCQSFEFSNKNYVPNLSSLSKSSVLMLVGNTTLAKSSKLSNVVVIHKGFNGSIASQFEDEFGDETDVENMEKDDLASDYDEIVYDRSEIEKDSQSQSDSDQDQGFRKKNVIQRVKDADKPRNTNTLVLTEEVHEQTLDEKQFPKLNNTRVLNGLAKNLNNNSVVIKKSILRMRRGKITSIAQMNSALLQISGSVKLMKPKWSSPHDQELKSARVQIERAPIIRKSLQLDASLFRNVSIFIRSYELMERILKVYIYKEGEKPTFHQSYLRGIYSSEGWFMKLIQGNKQFVIKDPRKAHLFYLPVSFRNLRNLFHQEGFARVKDLEKHLQNYTDTIAKKYRFWNRARGADHFLVGCHDWAPRIARKSTGNSIRVLCNSNVARGFTIGRDVSLPVTYIRSSENPQKDLGGNPPSERPILAFFAGSKHGYLRPILLQYWENKEPDMKIFGPMPRDIEGKSKYREYMKTSKYCICARGYEVHTPRIVEAIYYECVPVIISDNYVPPFFEVLDWEKFSVFVSENDIPILRNILLSIPEEKYLAMQQRAKMVQRHFLWHKKPVKYDLFHMTLHSIWYNRVFQV